MRKVTANGNSVSTLLYKTKLNSSMGSDGADALY
jgi:hypothetical protein